MRLLLNCKLFFACLVTGLLLAPAGGASSPRPPARVDPHSTNVERRSPVTAAFDSSQDDPQPDAKLTPEQVIKIQLDALRRNDEPDADSGIRTAFRFASPANREATGPIERFIPLVKNPLYLPLLNHRRADLGTLRIEGDTAQQRVTVIAKDGRTAVYVFTLSKQAVARYEGCWMTDGVGRVPDAERRDDRGIARTNGHKNNGHGSNGLA